MNSITMKFDDASDLHAAYIQLKKLFPKVDITTKVDPFWSDENQAHLRKVVAALNAREGLIEKTMEELEAMAE